MTVSQLNAAVIGLGVGERHIYGYETEPRCRVIALCDINAEKLQEVGHRHPGKKITQDPEEIFLDTNIQVVSVASYDDVHCSQVVAAIKGGKHVFVEKPLCLTRWEYETIADTLNQHPKTKLSSNLILRKTPRFLGLKNRLSKGELGQIYYLEGDYDYGRVHKITEGWRGQIPNYSVVHSGAIHLIDLLCWLTGQRVWEVFAYGNRIATHHTSFKGNDLVAALLKFENGAIAKVTANFACNTPHFHRVSVYGTSGTFQQSHSGTVYLQSRDAGVPPQQVTDAYPGATKGDIIPSFVRSILDNEVADVTAQEVFDVMAISLAIEESLQYQCPVRVHYAELLG